MTNFEMIILTVFLLFAAVMGLMMDRMTAMQRQIDDLKKDSHPPVDLEPAVRDITHRILKNASNI